MGNGEAAAEINSEILKQKPADAQLSAIAANNLLAQRKVAVVCFFFCFSYCENLFYLGTAVIRFSEENESMYGKRSTKQNEHVSESNGDQERGYNADVVQSNE